MIYDALAVNVQSEYDLYLFALTGRYLSIKGTGAEVSPLTIRQVRTVGALLQKTFIKNASRLVQEFAHSYPSASAQARSDAFLGELQRMSESNIETLVLRLKAGSTNELAAVKNAHGAMGLLLQAKLAKPEFRITTKSGRSFDAARYLHTEARDLGYRIWIAFQLEQLGATGDLAQVSYPDPLHKNNGLVFSITGQTPGVPSFAQIEDDIFHYNAQARITPHVSPQ